MNPKFLLNFLQSLPSISLEESLADNSNLTLKHQPQPLVAMKGLPLQAPNLNAAGLGGGILIAAAGLVSIIVLLIVGLWAYKLVYNITPNNEAFVRTGGLFVKKKP
jgi:hypothetical protein